MRGAGWWIGRRPVFLAGGVTVALLLLYPWLWVAFSGPWAPFERPRHLQLFELVPVACGAVALYGILPGLRWVEDTSPRRLWVRDATAALGVILGFASMPAVVRWMWAHSSLYLAFLPANMVSEPPPMGDFAAFGLNIAAVLALACLTTPLIGPLLGPASGVWWLGVLLVAQGRGGLSLLVTADLGPPVVRGRDLVLVSVLVLVGTWSWGRGPRDRG